MLAFHGAGGNSLIAEASTGLSDLGNRADFIAVYPNAIGTRWDFSGPGTSDVIFVRSLLDTLESTLCIDDSRIYATGASNGGSLVEYLGCVLSDRLSAIAPVAGGHGVQPPCQLSRPISVLEIHGTSDRVVPYGGHGPHGEGSVSSFLGLWYRRDACPRTAPIRRRLGPRVLYKAKTGCAGGATVAHVKLIGEPHAWPTTKAPHVRRSGGVRFSASRAVWEFFSTETVSPQRR